MPPASLANPGGNITGVSDLTDETTLKRLELLKVALPNASRVVFLLNPEFLATPKIEARVRAAAPTLRLNVTWLYAKDRVSLAQALDSLEKSPPDALFAAPPRSKDAARGTGRADCRGRI